MSKDYRTREGTITAVDTRTALTTLASATPESPANIPVPKDKTVLLGIWVAVGVDYGAAGSASFFIRLEGDGLEDSPQFAVAGAYGGNLTSGARNLNPARFIPLDVPVIPGNTIAVSAEMCGVDIGTASISVTLVFQ